MKKLFYAFVLLFVIPAAVAQSPQDPVPPAPGTNPLVDFTRGIKYDGLNLSVVLLNEKTVEIIYANAPTKAAMKVRSRSATFLYVQGTPQKDFEMDSTVTIEQGTEKLTGTSHSIKNFEKKKIAKGERIDGLVEFTKKVDLTKPFTVKIGQEAVEFVLTPEALKSIGS
jgi:hypothetical protein